MIRAFILCLAVCALLFVAYLLGNVHGYQAGRREATMERIRVSNDSFLRSPNHWRVKENLPGRKGASR